MSTSTQQSNAPIAQVFRTSYLKAVVVFLTLTLCSITTEAATYYWVGSSGANWSGNSSWNTSPDGSGTYRKFSGGTANRSDADVLKFTKDATVTLDVSETVAQVIFTTVPAGAPPTVSLTVNTTGPNDNIRTISVTGAGGFQVDAGAKVSMVGTNSSGGSGDAGVKVLLSTSAATAIINGTVSFEAGGGSATSLIHNYFQGTVAHQIIFGASSKMITVASAGGAPLVGPYFDYPNMVSFQPGATFEQNGGDDPYNEVPFGTGTMFRYISGNYGAFSASRNYGYLEFANTNAVTLSGNAALIVQNDLTITNAAATVNNNLTGTGTTVWGVLHATLGTLNFVPPAASSLSVQGATLVEAGATLDFNPTASSTANFWGDVTVAPAGTLTIDGNTTAATLQMNLIDNGNFNFLIDASGTLSVGRTTTVGNGTNAAAFTFEPSVASSATFLGNVSVAANAAMAMQGNMLGGTTPGVNFKANVTNSGLLSFSPISRSRIAFNGTTAQSIGTSGVTTVPPTFNTVAELTIDNLAGVTVNVPFTVTYLNLSQGLLNTSKPNMPNVPVSAGIPNPIIGGSSLSFVNGPIARTVNGQNIMVAFPVGKVSNNTNNYRPVVLNNVSTGGAVTYIGEQIDLPATGPLEGDPTSNGNPKLNHVSFVRYFSLTPDVLATTFNGSVTLSYGLDDYVTNPTAGSFVVAQRDAGGPWRNIGSTNTGPGTLFAAQQVGTLTSASFTTFNTISTQFALASTEPSGGFPGLNPLPVELTTFTATTKANGIALDWATASEKNSAYFEVQRSATGETFQAIAKVQAQGNSTAARAYTSLDRKPLAGLAYYRLRQVDLDGTTSYSPVVTARWDDVAALELYPNPTSDKLYLGNDSGSTPYRVLNLQGQALLSGETAGANGVSVKALPAGIYLLELTTPTGRKMQRFVRE